MTGESARPNFDKLTKPEKEALAAMMHIGKCLAGNEFEQIRMTIAIREIVVDDRGLKLLAATMSAAACMAAMALLEYQTNTEATNGEREVQQPA